MRKCLLMVPRDEDGEKLARKRAKQRTILPPPPLLHMPSGDLALALGSPTTTNGSPVSPHSPSFGAPSSPRSGASSPELRAAPGATSADARAYGVGVHHDSAMTQALSEQSLFALALDDDHSSRPQGITSAMLTSAMLFSAIQTPAASPQHPSTSRHTAAENPGSKRHLELDGDADGDGAASSARAGAGLLSVDAAPALSAAFTAHIAAKLELDEPPKPPRLDELHEEFLLLNAEHRCSIKHDNASDHSIPILAF